MKKKMQEESRTALNHALGIIAGGRNSPLRSTLNTDWNDISRTQQNYHVRKVKEAIDSVLETVAPGQEKLLWEAVKTSQGITDVDEPQQKRKNKWDQQSIDTLHGRLVSKYYFYLPMTF